MAFHFLELIIAKCVFYESPTNLSLGLRFFLTVHISVPSREKLFKKCFFFQLNVEITNFVLCSLKMNM
jgi:hypothetical protein